MKNTPRPVSSTNSSSPSLPPEKNLPIWPAGLGSSLVSGHGSDGAGGGGRAYCRDCLLTRPKQTPDFISPRLLTCTPRRGACTQTADGYNCRLTRTRPLLNTMDAPTLASFV